MFFPLRVLAGWVRTLNGKFHFFFKPSLRGAIKKRSVLKIKKSTFQNVNHFDFHIFPKFRIIQIFLRKCTVCTYRNMTCMMADHQPCLFWCLCICKISGSPGHYPYKCSTDTKYRYQYYTDTDTSIGIVMVLVSVWIPVSV